MIYLDNAATTMYKPQCVVDAVVNALTSMAMQDVAHTKHPSMPQW